MIQQALLRDGQMFLGDLKISNVKFYIAYHGDSRNIKG